MEEQLECQFKDDCNWAGEFDDCYYDNYITFPCPNIEIKLKINL